MGWYSLYEYKKPTYPKLMRMFFANMRVNVEPRIISTLQGNPIEFNCAVLADILGISNDGPQVFEIKIIRPLKGAKIKSQDLLLRPRLIHRIIAHNILPKKGHYDEVTFMELCLIDCMIQRRPINLPYIMIRNMILAYDQKQKALPYGQVFTTIFEHFDILLTVR
ncbi:Retrovirus-related polyprotein from transposon [Salix suchowensis]|nr:Retrovirus-related polyprotein from transposon [Salix suchowensis]